MNSNRVEGLWDCSYCGKKGIRARFDRCQECGSARGAETVFYLPADIRTATLTEEEAAETTDAPDWLCNYCGCLNRADETVCRGCSADRAEATNDYATLHASTAGATYEQTLAGNAYNTSHNSLREKTGVLQGLAELFRKK
ncbi:MAG: hypothetical protein IJ600_01965 [Lachnospiraceae bacterium]|nr:hypothetical protein [Lachnospiraceae bacterium]